MPEPGKMALRDGFGQGLVELGRMRKDVFVLAGDLSESTRAYLFHDEFPDRFFNMGIAEQDMVGTAAGLALAGKIAFVSSFAVFLTSRAYDQIRISVCYNNQNVKLAGSHAGISVGPDGATAQAMEDIAIMRALPNMTVVAPADAVEARKATIAVAAHPGPVYLRLGRQPAPVVTREADMFEVGKAQMLRPGRDITIVACGIMVAEALRAADALASHGVDAGVINMHTIKPVDEAALMDAAARTRAILTVEEHQVHGGLGSAVAEVIAGHCPCLMDSVAVQDTFGESGESRELLQKYGLTWDGIRDKAVALVKKKQSGECSW